MAKISHNSVLGNKPATIVACTPWSEKEPISIDSCTIRIPAELVELKDESLLGDSWHLVNALTGEVDKTYQKPDEKSIDILGTMACKYRLGKGRYGNSTKSTNFLFIDFTSKVLGKDYFQGIHSDNIQQFHNTILSHKVVDFSLNDFLHRSACTDIDLKRDIVWNHDFSFPSYIKEMANNVKASKHKDAGCRIFNQRDNTGIYFGNRKATTFLQFPMLKIYDKHKEIHSKHGKFHSKYLSHVNTNNIIRTEAQLKSLKHLRNACGLESNSLGAVVGMPQKQKELAFTYAMQKHMPDNSYLSVERKVKDLGPSDFAFYFMLQEKRKRGVNVPAFIEKLVEHYDCKVTRSRMRKKLNSFNDMLSQLESNSFDSLMVLGFDNSLSMTG